MERDGFWCGRIKIKEIWDCQENRKDSGIGISGKRGKEKMKHNVDKWDGGKNKQT